MKIIEKKLDKVVIEITSEEITRIGFDKIWDDVRLIYPLPKFEVNGSMENHNGKIIIIILKDSEFYNSILKLNPKINDEDLS